MARTAGREALQATEGKREVQDSLRRSHRALTGRFGEISQKNGFPSAISTGDPDLKVQVESLQTQVGELMGTRDQYGTGHLGRYPNPPQKGPFGLLST